MKTRTITTKKVTALLVAMLLFTSALIPSTLAYYDESQEPEITVYVYLNKYDDEFILNTELDDGTVIGDHNYEIVYMDSLTISRAMSSLDAAAVYYPEYYFNYIAFHTGSSYYGGVTLTLDPNIIVREGHAGIAADAWTSLRDFWNPSNQYWAYETSMKAQYDCHYQFSKTYLFNSTWDLEPYRPIVSWATMISPTVRCNPT